MLLSALELPSFLKSGNKAHLIPVVKDSNKEVRATSSLLAVMMSVPEFGRAVLEYIGTPITKRSKIKCFTEIVFKDSSANDKPDGPIIIETGSNKWTCLIEAKVGTNKLESEQLERYLDLAKANSIDALVTISNQLAVLPSFHPVDLPKQKIRSLDIYHLSWKAIVTEALLLLRNEAVGDPTQEYILSELVRYLQFDPDVMLPFKRMPPSWKEVCMNFQQSLPVSRSPQTREVVENWHQLTRYLALQMSIAVKRRVTLTLTKLQKGSKETLIQDDLYNIVENGKLKTEFIVPDAAAKIRFKADMKRRTLSSSMKIDAPGDRAQARSSINWIFKQIEKCADNDIQIIVLWPGKTPQTHATLGKLKEDRSAILSDLTSSPPVSFIIRSTVDLAGKFSGVSILVEEAEKLLPNFYRDIGQSLQEWKPSAPRVSTVADEIIEGISHGIKQEEPTIILPPMVIPLPVAAAQEEMSEEHQKTPSESQGSEEK